MKKVRVRILIDGRLQAMNFRFNAQREANKLGLVGFIRNLSDGRIEIEAQGPEDKVQKILDWCQEEPHGRQIHNILFRYDEPVNRYADFSVR